MSRAPAILALLLLTVQPAWPQLLTPGKPAGTKAAQHISQHSLFLAGAAVAVALAFGLPSSTPSTATSTTTSTATTN